MEASALSCHPAGYTDAASIATELRWDDLHLLDGHNGDTLAQCLTDRV
jgi:YD repeat-containing protein